MKNMNLLILLLLVGIVIYFVYKNQENLNSSESETLPVASSDKKSNKVLGVYYTEWCGYSRNFLQQLDDGLQKKIENEGVTVNLVDCDKNKEMCQKLQIEGFPTVLLHKGDEIVHYTGNRGDDDLLHFVKST